MRRCVLPLVGLMPLLSCATMRPYDVSFVNIIPEKNLPIDQHNLLARQMKDLAKSLAKGSTVEAGSTLFLIAKPRRHKQIRRMIDFVRTQYGLPTVDWYPQRTNRMQRERLSRAATA